MRAFREVVILSPVLQPRSESFQDPSGGCVASFYTRYPAYPLVVLRAQGGRWSLHGTRAYLFDEADARGAPARITLSSTSDKLPSPINPARTSV